MAEEDFSAIYEEISFPESVELGNYRTNGFTALCSIGEIYSAIDLRNNSECSLIVIAPATAIASPDIAARLLYKAEKACFFAHKNFLSVRECFNAGECYCIVTVPLTGTSLRKAAEENRDLAALVPKAASEIASLMAAAANAPIPLYFQLTPDDIFITPEGTIKVIFYDSSTAKYSEYSERMYYSEYAIKGLKGIIGEDNVVLK